MRRAIARSGSATWPGVTTLTAPTACGTAVTRCVAGRRTCPPPNAEARSGRGRPASRGRPLAETAATSCAGRSTGPGCVHSPSPPRAAACGDRFPTGERRAVGRLGAHWMGLKPILRTVWTVPGQRPLAPVEQRYEGRSLVGFVHPASGRTVWQLATTVTSALFAVKRDAFARDRRGSTQTERARARRHGLACQSPGAGARTCAPAVPAAPFPSSCSRPSTFRTLGR
jgi:hypothetical protein